MNENLREISTKNHVNPQNQPTLVHKLGLHPVPSGGGGAGTQLQL